MGGYNHELALGLSPVKFVDQPVVPCLVQAGSCVSAVRGERVLFARVVEHDDLERHICPGLEGIGGEVVVDIGLGEAMSLRL